MSEQPWWSREEFWRKSAVFITAFMAIILMVLTFHSMSAIQAGEGNVPAYSVINQRVDYRMNNDRGAYEPVIGGEAPIFGEVLSEQQAYELVNLGKLTIQAKNCMNCHTLLGNGAYYAPDLTRAWLDPGWGNEEFRENLMFNFLLDPTNYARTYGTGRRMPNLGITEAEARGIMAYLKWMSAIDTNGFPYGFRTLPQGSD